MLLPVQLSIEQCYKHRLHENNFFKKFSVTTINKISQLFTHETKKCYVYKADSDR